MVIPAINHLWKIMKIISTGIIVIIIAAPYVPMGTIYFPPAIFAIATGIVWNLGFWRNTRANINSFHVSRKSSITQDAMAGFEKRKDYLEKHSDVRCTVYFCGFFYFFWDLFKKRPEY